MITKLSKKLKPLQKLRGKSIVAIAVAAVAALSGYYYFQPTLPNPYEIYKVSSVIDGDTFKIPGGQRVRLLGINAPEKGQCYYEEARDALNELIDGEFVRLDKDVEDKDRHGRLLRYIFLEKENTDNLLVNDYLVRNGFAFEYHLSPNSRYRNLFISAREEAKRENRGLWQACDYEEEKPARSLDEGPSDPNCIIKGNISEKSFGKTYLMPGCDNYNRVKIDTRKGEAYFCTEAEAQKAGFRKATNCP